MRLDYRGYLIVYFCREDGECWTTVRRPNRNRSLNRWRGSAIEAAKAWIDEKEGPVPQPKREPQQRQAEDEDMSWTPEQKKAFWALFSMGDARLPQLHNAAGVLHLSTLPKDKEVVEAAFRAQAKLNHPDHGGTAENMQRLNEARALLLSYAEDEDV